MAISKIDDIAAATAQFREVAAINKANVGTVGANEARSLWRATGNPPQAAVPTAAAILSNATLGAMRRTNPTGGRDGYLVGGVIATSLAGVGVDIFDRLAEMGGLNATTVGAQTVNVDVSVGTSNMALRRGAADYADVRWFVEIYTAIGVTAQTLTVTYTRADGTSGLTTTVSIGGAAPASNPGLLIPIVPANGDRIRSIQSVSLAVSTGTAGNFGITAARFITGIGGGAAGGTIPYDWQDVRLPKIEDSACLFLVQNTNTTSTGVVAGNLDFAQW